MRGPVGLAGLSRLALLGALLGTPALAQETPEARAAVAEAEAGARAFAEGDLAAAEARFARAAVLDPATPSYRKLRAASIARGVVPGNPSSENVELARRAAEAYREILAADGADEEAAQALLRLLDATGDRTARDAWLLSRSADPAVPAGRRAEALRLVADAELADARRELAARRPGEAARLAGRALSRLDGALALAPDAPALWGSRLQALELSLAAARARKDAEGAASAEARLASARKAAERAEEDAAARSGGVSDY